MRVPYYCPYCNQHSTRRWNLDVHIRRRHGGLLLDKSSDRYMGSNPLWYTPNDPYHNIGSTTIADSIGNTFETTYLRRQAPLGISQYSPNAIYRPTIDHQSFGTGLSQQTKLEELKKLVYKYPQYHNNGPDEILKWAIYCSSSGDNKFLDEMLEQLRTIDSLARF